MQPIVLKRISNMWMYSVVVFVLFFVGCQSTTPTSLRTTLSNLANPYQRVGAPLSLYATYDLGGRQAEDLQKNAPCVTAVNGQQTFITANNKGLVIALAIRQLATQKGTGLPAFLQPSQSLFEPLWRQHMNAAVTAGIVCDDRVAAFTTNKAQLVVMDLETGDVLWQKTLDALTFAMPVLGSNSVYVYSQDGKLHAFDKVTGALNWTNSVYGASDFQLRGQATPLWLDTTTLILTGKGGRIAGIDVISGKTLWERRVSEATLVDRKRLIGDIDADPLLHDKTLFTVGYKGQLTAIDVASGKPYWQTELSSNTKPFIDNKVIYVVDVDNNISGYNTHTGERVYFNDGLHRYKLSNPVVVHNTLVVGDNHGQVHMLPLNIAEKIIPPYNMVGSIETIQLHQHFVIFTTAKNIFNVWQAAR